MFVLLSPAFVPVSDGVRRSGVPRGLGGTVVVVVVEAVADPGMVVRVVVFGRGPVVTVVLRGEVVAVVPRRGAVVVVAVVEPVAVLLSRFPNGFDVSTVRARVRGVRDVFPFLSVATADTVHVPSASSGSVHPDVVDDTVYVHDTVRPPFVADTVTDAPSSTPGMFTKGVESAVTSSDDDTPVSLEAARSGRVGITGPSVSTVRTVGEEAGDTFPAGSVSVAVTDHVPSVSAGRSHDAAGST